MHEGVEHGAPGEARARQQPGDRDGKGQVEQYAAGRDRETQREGVDFGRGQHCAQYTGVPPAPGLDGRKFLTTRSPQFSYLPRRERGGLMELLIVGLSMLLAGLTWLLYRL